MVTIGEDVIHSLQYVDNDGVNRDTRANYQREDGSKFVAGSKLLQVRLLKSRICGS